jgi:hypothetical protein
MKKTFTLLFFLSLITFTLFSVSGCNDDSKDDWFISPTYINFYVTDSAGVNKLNSTGTLYDEYMKTTVTYNGKTYKCNEAVTPTDGVGLETADIGCLRRVCSLG